MKEIRYEPDVDTHNMIIEGLCLEGKMKEAESFSVSMKEKCLEDYSAMVNGYREANFTENPFYVGQRVLP